MKILPSILLAVAVVLLAGILAITWANRADQLADRQTAAAAVRASQDAELLADRETLMNGIIADRDRQFRFTHADVQNGIVDAATGQRLWTAYTNASAAASRWLASPDLQAEPPDLRFQDEEVKLHLLSEGERLSFQWRSRAAGAPSQN